MHENTQTGEQVDFVSVTETSGDEVSSEQVQRMFDRYHWAAGYCRNRDVVEIACGTGSGLGYLSKSAKSLVAGDISTPLVQQAKAYYKDRVSIERIDAQDLPFPDRSKDVIILFEAIYYLPSVPKFVRECARVLRPGGQVLIATANKDLFDFNPSPFSHTYYGVTELKRVFADSGFSITCFGNTPLARVSIKQRILRPVKKFAVQFDLIPKTTAGKKLFKRLVFGKLVAMPHEITESTALPTPSTPIPNDRPDVSHKVIFCAARLDTAN